VPEQVIVSVLSSYYCYLLNFFVNRWWPQLYVSGWKWYITWWRCRM